MSNDKTAATYHPAKEIPVTDEQTPTQPTEQVKPTGQVQPEPVQDVQTTTRPTREEQAEILRSQGATDEEITAYHDRTSPSGQEPDAKPKTTKK